MCCRWKSSPRRDWLPRRFQLASIQARQLGKPLSHSRTCQAGLPRALTANCGPPPQCRASNSSAFVLMLDLTRRPRYETIKPTRGYLSNRLDPRPRLDRTFGRVAGA